jgi:dTMP kinase
MREMFITIEGIDGCGKSTQALILKEKIAIRCGVGVVLTGEPGGTTVGSIVREVLLNKDMDNVTEFLLFAADRNEHIKSLIRPSINNGIIVISDRFLDSSVAYQGFGRGVSFDFINYVHSFITQGLKPDLTFIVDLEPEVGLRRLKKTDRIENGGLEFLRRVREGYIELSKRDRRFVVIKGEMDLDIVSDEIWENFLIRRKEWIESQKD